MKKVYLSLVLVLTIFVIGCESKETESSKKVVKDDAIKTTLINHISAIESIPKTIELYKNKKILSSDYNNEDYIHITLNNMTNTHQDTYLTEEEIKTLLKNEIIAQSYINADDVSSEAKKLIGPKSIDKVLSIGDCPSYVFDSASNKYYINTECESKNRIISYISEITYNDNDYSVVVYAGYVYENTIYDNVNKEKEISKLDGEGSYSIDETNKDSFSKYVYNFKRNSDGDFIFESIEK